MRFRPVDALALWTALGGAAVGGDDPWSRGRSAHFEVLAERPSDDAAALAGQLERLRALLLSVLPVTPAPEPPTLVLGFGSSRSFAEVVPTYHGKRQEVDGFFHTGSDRSSIVVNLASSRARPLETAYHEYVHVFLAQAMPAQPPWLAEGLAEAVSDWAGEGSAVVFDGPRPEHLAELRTYALLPLPTLLRVGYLSPLYNEGDRRGQFYAESWALVSVLLRRGGSDAWRQIQDYARAMAAGESPEPAFERVFGQTIAGVTAELARTIEAPAAGELRLTFELPAPAPAASPSLPPARAEMQSLFGELLVLDGRSREAKARFDRALQSDPGYAPALVGLAQIGLRDGHLKEARRHLDAARQRSADDPQVLFTYAEMLLREASDAGVPPSDEITSAAVAALEKAVAVAPLYADACDRLARLQPRPLDARIALLQRAFAANPGRADLALTLSWLHLQTDDLARAAAVLERGREATRDEDLRFLCDLQLKRIATAQTVTTETEGVLVSLECLPGGALDFVVASGDRRLRLHVPTAASVLLYRPDGERLEKTFTCGPQRAPVKAWFKRPDPTSTAGDGTLLSLVFRQ